MWLDPVTLIGERLELEPLALSHSDELRGIADIDLFKYYVTVRPRTMEPSDWDSFHQSLIASQTTVPFVARERAGGRAVGSSCLMDIRPEHRGLEVGMTWIAREWQGTWVNPEMKLLMMTHAFETLGAIRVQLKCDSRNLHSRRAILKLGATYEGDLRRHGILLDGYVRDTSMYSILDEEWPRVKAGLIERLERLATG